MAGEALDLVHHRREARDRADAQVVAVGEAAGDDHRVDAAQVAVARATAARASPTRARGQQRVDLVARAGEADDAELHDVGRSRSPRSAGWRAAARTSRGSCDGSSTSSSTSRPTWTLAHALEARAPAARARRPGPAGRGSRPWAGSGPAPSRAPTRSSQARERLAGQPLVGGHVALARGGDDVVGDRRRRRRLVPARARTPSRARTACRTTAGRGPARTRRPARSARSPACRPRRRAPARRRRRARTRTSCRRGSPRARARASATALVDGERHVAQPLGQLADADQLDRRARSRSPRRGPPRPSSTACRSAPGSCSDSCRPVRQLDARDRAGAPGSPSSPSR